MTDLTSSKTVFRCRFHSLMAVILILFLIVTGFMGCDQKKAPIKVGFVGPLSGRLSVLGVAGRNGAILAVEEANGTGGVNGHPVELIVRNDEQDEKKALKSDKELLNENVAAIIGHMTSTMSLAALPLCNRMKIPMISPTTSTPRLSGLDDYFFRVIPANTSETDHLAGYARKGMGLLKMIAIIDLSNSVYTEEFYKTFKFEFERLGGHMLPPVTFTSGPGIVFGRFVKKILSSGAEGLLLLTGSLHDLPAGEKIRRQNSDDRLWLGHDPGFSGTWRPGRQRGCFFPVLGNDLAMTPLLGLPMDMRLHAFF